MARKFISYNGRIVGNGGLSFLSVETTPVPSFVNQYSMSLDGSNEYFTAGNPASLQITGAFTLSVWVKIASSGGQSQQCIISKDNGSSQRSYTLWAYTSFLSAPIAYILSGASAYSVQGTTNIRDGFWHHIMLVYTPSISLNMYVDGVLEGSNTTSIPSSINNVTQDFQIGRFGTGTFQVLGNIDEVAVWNSDQNTNVSTIYNGGEPADLSSLSPLSWWRMGDGDTWGGSSWTLTDNGSGGNDATSVFMEEADRLPISPNSYSQNSFVFDGIGDYIYAGTSSLGITGAISVSAWVKIPTTNTGGGGTNIQVIACEDNTSGGQRNWNMYWRGTGFNYFAWVIFHTNLSSSAVISTGVVPNDGQWHHLLGTYDGTTNANGIKLYIDGVLNVQGTAGSTGINSFTSTEPTIGALTGGINWRLEGTVDEVSIWNSNQSANISTIFNNGVPQDISSLSPLSHWRMGENATWDGANWTLTDQGSGGNDATSVSMPVEAKTGDQPYVL